MRYFNRSSIRLRLTLGTLVPLVAAIAICWVIGASIITTRLMTQAQKTVESDLATAAELLQGELSLLTDTIRLTGQSPELATWLADQQGPPPAGHLQLVMRNEQLSFMTLVDRYGFVRYRAAHQASSSGQQVREKLVTDALKGVSSSCFMVLSPEEALRENPQLAGRLDIRLRQTPQARTYTKQLESRGLFLMAAAPVIGAGGDIIGAVYGGLLLNNNNRLIERITRIIFHHGTPVLHNTGNATIFLDDVRIATTVLDESGKPAIGSIMSSEVNAVVGRGERWTGPAFVLNERYFAAYRPLRDSRGSVIGALYVGMPERPYLQLRSRINLTFSAVLLVVTLIGIGFSAWMGNRMSRPIKALEEGVRRIAAGEELPDVQVDSRDEIGALAAEFNSMKHRLAERGEENRILNRTLEEKVVERTTQLEEKNRLLLEAQQRLAEAERLAGIGLLASGVAHEINNPLAIIRGNVELLEMDLPADSPSREEVEIIDRQAARIERIVSGLLQFGRRKEQQMEQVDLHAILEDVLAGVGHQVPLAGIAVIRDWDPALPEITADGDQLLQVFTNLAVNAVQAMPEGGKLVMTTRFAPDTESCTVVVSDTGIGIPQQKISRIFNPFFSTKATGTGLGLSISYGIIKEHRGTIEVSSTPGAGTSFTVTLPCR